MRVSLLIFAAIAVATPVASAQDAPSDETRALDRLQQEEFDVLDLDTPKEIGLGRYIAVLFSAQDYASGSGLRDLNTPNRDIEEIGSVLRDQYGFDVRSHPNATRQNIIGTLDELTAELTEDDLVILYYAGHGVERREEEQGYWLPADADSRNSANWVSTADVSAKVRAMKARHVLTIVDSCFSGEFTRGTEETLELTASPSRKEAINLSSQRSRWVLASGGNEPVADGGADGMSVYAYFLREALKTAEDRYVIPDRLFPVVRSAVVQNSAQTPSQGKLLRGMTTTGQPVLLNRLSCQNTVQPLVERERRRAEQDWQTSVIAREGHDAAQLAALDGWIQRWTDHVVPVCADRVSVTIPRMGDAESLRSALRERLSPSSRRRARSKALLAGGALTLAAGAGMVTGSNIWWTAHRGAGDFTVDPVNGVIQYTDPAVGESIRRVRTVQAFGVVAGALGGITVGAGTVSLLLIDNEPAGAQVAVRW